MTVFSSWFISVKYIYSTIYCGYTGAYCPRYFMSSQHVDPEQAFQIHKDLKSKLSIGIHWGTFPMGSTEVSILTLYYVEVF